MPSANEVLQMINRDFGHTPTETIEELNDLINQLPKCSFKDNLIEERDDYCERTEYCKCGNKLEIVDQWKESRGEMLGRVVYEDIYVIGCTSCGYIKQ
jgi:hypothetical protein